MAIRIGANPIGWTNDDMVELGDDIPLEQCLSEAKAAGFEGMELGRKFPRKADELGPILHSHGLALISGWYSSSLLVRDARAEREALAPHLDLLKTLGAPVLILAETSNATHGDRQAPISRRPVLETGAWPVFGRRLTELAEAVAGEGIALVYHHHMGTAVQSGEDIDRLMEATGPAVHLLLDTGHALWGGADPADLARRYCGRIVHFHAKDIRGDVRARVDAADMSFCDAVVEGVFTVPGDGMIDFAAVLRELGGYDGWLVVEAEQDPEKAPPAQYARMGHDNLLHFAREAGLL